MKKLQKSKKSHRTQKSTIFSRFQRNLPKTTISIPVTLFALFFEGIKSGGCLILDRILILPTELSLCTFYEIPFPLLYVSIFLFISISIYLSIYIYIYLLSIYIYIHLSFCIYLYLSIFLFISIYIYLSIYIYIYIYLSFYL